METVQLVPLVLAQPVQLEKLLPLAVAGAVKVRLVPEVIAVLE